MYVTHPIGAALMLAVVIGGLIVWGVGWRRDARDAGDALVELGKLAPVLTHAFPNRDEYGFKVSGVGAEAVHRVYALRTEERTHDDAVVELDRVREILKPLQPDEEA